MPKRTTPKTWLITGCSSGIGRALAQAVLENGDNAVVTARRTADITDITEAHPDSALTLALDVTDPAQQVDVVKHAVERFGAIDVLVNNAGYGLRAAVEEANDSEVRDLFDTHVFGPLALIREVLPGMRERREGTIVNLSSIGVQMTTAGSGHYSAAKAAVEGFTGALRKEVEPLGITAFSVEPGGFNTDFMSRSLRSSERIIEDYDGTVGVLRRVHDHSDDPQPGDPARAATALIHVVESGRAPEVLVLASDAVGYYRRAAQSRLEDLEEWSAVSMSTDVRDSLPDGSRNPAQ